MSKVGQFYHNVTAKYNGWFNANELVDASIARLEEQHLDNYNEILPIYEYAAVDNADAVKADLDEAIKKVSVVVTLHEYSDWSDDCYLLIGKSMYLKKDYEAAENAFEFYMDEFLPNGKRANLKGKKNKKLSGKSAQKENASNVKEANKRKKELEKARKKAEKERKAYNKELRKRKKKGKSTDDLVRPGTQKAPDGTVTVPTPDAKNYQPTEEELRAKAKAEGEAVGVLGHEPVYDEAILWLAKTYIERENWTAADYQFRRLESDDVLPAKVFEELPVARAYYHMVRSNYPQVIPFLDQAIERATKRSDKARYSYIIAQLYDREGNAAKAAEYYQASLGYSNQYEMELNTQLSIIRSSVKNKTMTLADARQSLEKMIRDDKNSEYKGRIYYVLAELSIEENDIPGAIASLENSILYIGQDKFQEIESQYLLATLYLQQPDYVNAETAFKAAANVMAETDERYKYTKKMADNLRDIAQNLEVITLQDSLLVLSYKTPEELKELAKEIKKAKQKEEAEALTQSKYASLDAAKVRSGAPSSGIVGANAPQIKQVAGSTGQQTLFWAFDQKNIKKTRREFEKVWGDIPLTDHWRVSSRASQFASASEEINTNASGEISVYESEIQNFFKDVPKNDSARAISHTTIRKSMLLLGQLYRDRLEDFDSSIKVLEDMLAKYPDAPEKLETYYQLYLSSLSAGDHARTNQYKDLIVKNYPNSRFAKVLSDPDFAASQESERNKLEAYYNETYGYFESGNYDVVLERLEGIEDQFGVNNAFMARFDLLRAMSIGSQMGKEAYVDGLKNVIAKYPNTPEQTKARDMLLLLGDGNQSKGYGETGLSTAKFTMEDNALHFVIVYVSNQEELSIQDTKIALARFNNQYYQNENLKLANLVFDPSKNHSLVLIRSFNTKEKAMQYYDTVLRNPKDFLPAHATYEVYPITQKNYREVIKARSLDQYKDFFLANY